MDAGVVAVGGAYGIIGVEGEGDRGDFVGAGQRCGLQFGGGDRGDGGGDGGGHAELVIHASGDVHGIPPEVVGGDHAGVGDLAGGGHADADQGQVDAGGEAVDAGDEVLDEGVGIKIDRGFLQDVVTQGAALGVEQCDIGGPGADGHARMDPGARCQLQGDVGAAGAGGLREVGAFPDQTGLHQCGDRTGDGWLGQTCGLDELIADQLLAETDMMHALRGRGCGAGEGR